MFDLRKDERLLKIGYAGGDGVGAPDVAGAWYLAVAPWIAAGAEEDALRECAREFYAAVPWEARTDYNPNWGDLFTDVGPETLGKHGFRVLPLPCPDDSFVVDHDEPLFDNAGAGGPD